MSASEVVGAPKSKRWGRKHSGGGVILHVEKSKQRDRKDSGYSDEDIGNAPAAAAADAIFLQWCDIIRDWSENARSVINQEAQRMLAVSDVRRREMHSCHSQEEREAVVRKWSSDLTAAMETAQDLVHCVANDAVEEASNSSSDKSSQASMSNAHDMGMILEEELTAAAAKVRKDRKKQQMQQQKQEKSKLKSDDSASGQWGVEARHSNDKAWSSEEVDKKQQQKKKKNYEAEDFFSEWLEMSGLKNARPAQEINKLFWSISMEEKEPRRQRRISEVLENLPPSYDQPDIFNDRCELLEAMKPRRRARHGKRPPKCYWNIFNEWKHNLVEKAAAKKKRKRVRKGRQRRPYNRRHCKTLQRTKARRQEKDLPKHHEFAAKMEERDAEVGGNMCGSRGRRRSREELEAEDEVVAEDEIDLAHAGRGAKRLKRSEHPEQYTWESILLESAKSLDNLTRNLEGKIKDALMLHRDASEAHLGRDEDYYEDCDIWPDSQDNFSSNHLRDSFAEFSLLRDEVRHIRKDRRRSLDELAFFHEWNWNLGKEEAMEKMDEESDDDDEGEMEEQEDVFATWRHVFEGQGMMQMPSQSPVHGKKVVSNKSAAALGKSIIILPPFSKEIGPKQVTWDRRNCTKDSKSQMRLMSKCFARQPPPRGRQ